MTSFPKETPEKPWTGRKRYKKWISKLTRKHARTHRTKTEDLCVGENSICKGDLGIPRKYMPQFEGKADIQRFTRFIKKAYNIRSFKTTRKATQLRPSQKEINRILIQKLIKDNILQKVNVPIVVSGDNYIVDGHHRWAAFRLNKSKKPIPSIVIDAPIKDVLGIAVAWGAKHHEFNSRFSKV